MENKKENKTFDDIIEESQCLGECEPYGYHFYFNNKYQMLLLEDCRGLIKYEGQDEHVVIPEGVVCLWPGAFSHNPHIKSVVIPDSVETIDDYAFYFCPELEEVRFGSNVKYIGKWAFCTMGYESLFIELPDSVESIGDKAFVNCGITALPKNLKNIGVGAFQGCCWSSDDDVSEEWLAEIPDGVTTIEDFAFADIILGDGCQGVWLPKTVKKIGKCAFGHTTKYRKSVYTLYYDGTKEQWRAIDIDNTDDWLKDIMVKVNSIDGIICLEDEVLEDEEVEELEDDEIEEHKGKKTKD